MSALSIELVSRALACAALLTLSACSNDEPAPAPPDEDPVAAGPESPDDGSRDPEAEFEAVDPYEELGTVWRRLAASRDAADPADIDLTNALIQDLVLPPIEDAQWQVQCVLPAPTADFYAELVSDSRTLLTMELRHRGDVTQAERNAFGNESFRGYPCSRRSRFFFVLVGNVELRVTGEDPAFRSGDSIEPVLKQFPLIKLEKF